MSTKRVISIERWLCALALCGLLVGCDNSSAPPDSGTRDGGGQSDASTADAGVDAGSQLDPLDCEVAIVGGGAGGLHTAFRLAPELGDGVCLFEREATLGGRIHDEPRDPSDPSSPRMGTGALRVMEGQQVLLDLATELGVTLQTPTVESDLINARGLFAFGKDAFSPRYPGLMLDPDGDDHESFLYDALRFGPERANVRDYADFRSYVRSTVGAAGWDFLRDMSRFRADFEYPLDARGYLDWLDEEWDVCCTPSYPVGGMSEFIRGMEREATEAGARIFTSESVRSIRAAQGGGYALTTDAHEVSAGRVVIAVPPFALDHIEGDVVERIREQPEYQAILGVRVVTVTQWWDEAWWSEIRNPNLETDNRIWRTWTTEHCVNFVEIPMHEYGAEQRVTRSVYDDDLNCVTFWEETYRAGGVEAVEAEIRRGLAYLYDGNGATTPAEVTIPDPVRTHVQVWPAGWHWLRAGATMTNADVFDWAVAPLGEAEEVALVGEAYNPQRSGWSDAAFKSSIHLLNTRYGLDLPIGGSMTVRSERPRRSQLGH